MDGQTAVESVGTPNAEIEDLSAEKMPVVKCASPVKTPSESVSDSDDDFEDARDAVSSSRAVDEDASNGTGDDEDLSEDDVIVDFLGKSTEEAEARLAVRRQARAEAREIRMRELERQQKEADENADRIYDMHPENALRTPPVRTGSSASGRTPVVNSTGGSNYQWSRRSSEDSLEDGATERGTNLRDVRHELKEVDDKFRKAMIQNAQLDNEKASFTYQVELLKDRLEDLEVAHSQLQKEHKEKGRKADQLKRLAARLKEDLDMCKAALDERDRLIQEQGLVIVGDEGEMDGCEDGDVDGDAQDASKRRAPRKALVSIESAEMLQRAGEGSLDVRLRKFAEERNELMDQVRHLKLELEEERNRHRNGPRTASINGGSDTDMEDVQREANKLLGDYKFKLQKAEQDVSTLQANVARLESQVIRYKSAAETAERVEDELKSERRRLQREEDGVGVTDTGTQTSISEGVDRVCETLEQTDESCSDLWATISEDMPKSRQNPSNPIQHEKDEDELDFWATISTETDIIPKRRSIPMSDDDEDNQIDDLNGEVDSLNDEVQEINGQIEIINEQIGDVNDEIEDINEQIEEANAVVRVNGGETEDACDNIEDRNDRSESNDQIEDSSDAEDRNDRSRSNDQNGVTSDGIGGDANDDSSSNQNENMRDELADRSESIDPIEDTSDEVEERNDRSESNDHTEDRSCGENGEDKSSAEAGFWSERENSSEGSEGRINGRKASTSVKDEGEDESGLGDDKNDEEAKTISEERLQSDSLSFYEETVDKPEVEDRDDSSSDRCSFHTDSEEKSEAENGDTFEDAERINVSDVENRNGLRRNDSVDFWNVIKDTEETCPLEYSVGFTLMKPKKKSISREAGSDDIGDLSFVSDSGSRVDRSSNSHLYR